ncbi:MAG: hypothetical protein ABR587_14320 [Candidatus Binatia bacterium]
MKSRWAVVAAAALALLTATVVVRTGLWSRPLSMDNRFYFYMSERAASGVAPHVSSPDVKTQLSTLADAASISLGRAAGLDDVRAGRIGTLLYLIVGIWGIGLSVYALGTTGGAAAIAALSVLSFSNLAGHTAVGFNPKILLFTFLAWGPWLVARGRFAWAGAAASLAMLCWQPAAAACVATALGALAGTSRLRALAATIAGGVAAFVLYHAYFAWHGALAAQLFQSWALPLGSVREDAVDWLSGARFVIFGFDHGVDRFGIPGISFVLFVLGGIAALVGVRVPAAGRTAAPPAAVILVLVAGSLMCWFSAYEHQAEPDRFLLIAYFAVAIGVVADRVVTWVRTRIHERTSYQLEGALLALLLTFTPRSEFTKTAPADTLDGQLEAAGIVAMASEAYGSVWAYGCIHLLGLAHLTNYHPVEHFWDDLRRYVDETTFEPRVHGRLPDVILRCQRLPGRAELLEPYTLIRTPGLAERAGLFVRTSALASSAAERKKAAPRAFAKSPHSPKSPKPPQPQKLSNSSKPPQPPPAPRGESPPKRL